MRVIKMIIIPVLIGVILIPAKAGADSLGAVERREVFSQPWPGEFAGWEFAGTRPQRAARPGKRPFLSDVWVPFREDQTILYAMETLKEITLSYIQECPKYASQPSYIDFGLLGPLKVDNALIHVLGEAITGEPSPVDARLGRRVPGIEFLGFDGSAADFYNILTRIVIEHYDSEGCRREMNQSSSKAPPARPAGTVFRDCEECPGMVVVPAGGFLKGSPDSERGGYGHEGPVHRVEFARSFAMGAYEVTFAQWDACVAGGGCRGYRPSDEGWGRGTRPVIHVSWEDAQSYVRWLSQKTGREYRLPSESEWEYAARAGTDTRYHWGDEVGRNRANCKHCGSRWDGERTAPAGSFEANGFGLHDVHGNVWEWVDDCWNVDRAGAPADGSAWRSGDCGLHVLRGGSWFNYPRSLRSAYRLRSVIGNRFDDVGFRVARTLAP